VYKEVNEMPRCAACGRPLLAPSMGIPAERLGRKVEFCSDRCVRLFDTYKEPKYGDQALEGIPSFVFDRPS